MHNQPVPSEDSRKLHTATASLTSNCSTESSLQSKLSQYDT